MRVIAIAVIAALMVAAASALTEPDRMHVKDNIDRTHLNIDKEKIPSNFAVADEEGGTFGWGGYGGFGGYGLGLGYGYGIGYPLYGYSYGYPYGGYMW